MIPEALLKAALSIGAGCVIGWGANSLTLNGRVDAIERSLQRIELLLYVPADKRPRLGASEEVNP